MEVNEQRELVCTVSRLDLLAPRVRYNVHDQGGQLPFERVAEVLARYGYDLRQLGQAPETAGPRGPLPWAEPIPLPFLWVNGRRDATVSVMGANIYPEDVETALYRDAEVVPRLSAFRLSVVDDADGTPRPHVALEMEPNDFDSAWRDARAVALRDRLADLNADFRQSVGEFPAAMTPILETFGPGEGPFAVNRMRIKQQRIGVSTTGAGGGE
jgi:phenylacetate-CoA ligase